MALTATDRPISLLSAYVQTVHTDILKTRMEKVLDESQRGEQDGFRMGYSTVDHLQTTNQMIEKCYEFKRPFCIGYVDYEKAFDSTEHEALFKALRSMGTNYF